MRNSSPDDFEKKLIALLKEDSIPGLTSNAEFLKKLNQSLSPLRQAQVEPPFYRIWFNGVFNGLAAAAIGLILFVGLQILPPLFVNASITGTGLIQAKIVRTTVNQSILWQQLAIDIQKFK